MIYHVWQLVEINGYVFLKEPDSYKSRETAHRAATAVESSCRFRHSTRGLVLECKPGDPCGRCRPEDSEREYAAIKEKVGWKSKK